MLVNEIFESIQGEGKYAGYPVLFIRLSGCNKKCEWCDTKYHAEGKSYKIKEIVETIKKSTKKIIVWTGGEPVIQIKEILDVISQTQNKKHHVETNGSIFFDCFVFNYVCFSPKDEKVIKNINNMKSSLINYDIKVVTDCKLNHLLLKHATVIMPLTTNDENKNIDIKRNVWNMCSDTNMRFCLRQHVEVWKTKKGV